MMFYMYICMLWFYRLWICIRINRTWIVTLMMVLHVGLRIKFWVWKYASLDMFYYSFYVFVNMNVNVFSLCYSECACFAGAIFMWMFYVLWISRVWWMFYVLWPVNVLCFMFCECLMFLKRTYPYKCTLLWRSYLFMSFVHRKFYISLSIVVDVTVYFFWWV